MKKALIAIAIAAFAQTASAAISGSLHDLSTRTGASQSSCAYCHAPHHASTAATGTPLWNRDMSAQTFTQATTAGSFTRSGAASLTCLSCHDGTIGLGLTLNTDDTLTPPNVVAPALIGNTGSLTSDHPVGVSYPAAGTSTGATLRPHSESVGLLAGMTSAKLATLECSGCHDPHLTTNAPFLRASLATICVACHAK